MVSDNRNSDMRVAAVLWTQGQDLDSDEKALARKNIEATRVIQQGGHYERAIQHDTTGGSEITFDGFHLTTFSPTFLDIETFDSKWWGNTEWRLTDPSDQSQSWYVMKLSDTTHTYRINLTQDAEHPGCHYFDDGTEFRFSLVHNDFEKYLEIVVQYTGSQYHWTVYYYEWSGPKHHGRWVPEYVIPDAVSGSSGSVDIDLSAYATKTWVNEQNYLTKHQDIDLSGYALKSDIPDVSAFLTEHQPLDGYATKEYADGVGSSTLNTLMGRMVNQLATKAELSDIPDVSRFVDINAVHDEVNAAIEGKADKSELPAEATRFLLLNGEYMYCEQLQISQTGDMNRVHDFDGNIKCDLFCQDENGKLQVRISSYDAPFWKVNADAPVEITMHDETNFMFTTEWGASLEIENPYIGVKLANFMFDTEWYADTWIRVNETEDLINSYTIRNDGTLKIKDGQFTVEPDKPEAGGKKSFTRMLTANFEFNFTHCRVIYDRDNQVISVMTDERRDFFFDIYNNFNESYSDCLGNDLVIDGNGFLECLTYDGKRGFIVIRKPGDGSIETILKVEYSKVDIANGIYLSMEEL